MKTDGIFSSAVLRQNVRQSTVNPNTPHLRQYPSELPQEQLERVEKILDQVLTYLRTQSRNLPPEAGLALNYELRPEADR